MQWWVGRAGQGRGGEGLGGGVGRGGGDPGADGNGRAVAGERQWRAGVGGGGGLNVKAGQWRAQQCVGGAARGGHHQGRQLPESCGHGGPGTASSPTFHTFV